MVKKSLKRLVRELEAARSRLLKEGTMRSLVRMYAASLRCSEFDNMYNDLANGILTGVRLLEISTEQYESILEDVKTYHSGSYYIGYLEARERTNYYLGLGIS